MAAAGGLTEEAIRSRVGLNHDNLEDVKSLSLPGTYNEKVSSLGNSLRKFTRLKKLDLSRNSLTNINGLEHLKLLETLNLYYNGINSLDDVKCLRHNSNLVEIDLRLNPVARDEPDYRLYLIHLLPNLQKLDDRGVRDRERQAALVHFTSSQAAEFSAKLPVTEPVERPTNPRADYVRSVNKRVTALDDDDVEVLDLIARTGGDLSKPRQITGSTAKEDHVEEYSLDVLKKLPDSSLETRNLPQEQCRTNVSVNPEMYQLSEEQAYYNNKYPNIPNLGTGQTDLYQQQHQNGPQSFGDPNLKYTDEADAYTKYKGHGFFTPNPDFQEMGPSQPVCQSQPPPGGPPPPQKTAIEGLTMSRNGMETQTAQQNGNVYNYPVQKLEFDSTLQPAENGTSRQTAPLPSPVVTFPDNSTPLQRELLIKIMDLVDKYWNGSRSLHKNPKFKSISTDLLASLENALLGSDRPSHGDLQRLQDKVTFLNEENQVLKDREISYKNITTTSSLNETELKMSLKQAYEDVEALRSHLQKYMNENKHLQKKLQDVETTTTSVPSSTVNQTQLDAIERENGDLKQEVDRLRIRLKQLGQVQEMASMLQESHKSLVQTNDHLLKEIDETRSRHQHEVRQLHWSYDQLKKTMTSLNGSSLVNSAAEF